MYRVSVIMPVYNNEKTIERAIESILKQSIYDLELILVNDGSTDASGQICEEYARKEPLLVEAIHQEKSGFGIARNRGLLKAKGEFVYFASAKDTFDSKMLEANISVAQEKQANLVVFGFKDPNHFSIDGGIVHLPRMPYLSSQKEFRNHYRNFHHFYPYALHNKLYRRDYLLKNRIKFYKIPLNEAAFFNLNVYKDLHNVAFNRVSYCDHTSEIKTSGYEENLFEVNMELAKYLEAVIRYWGYEEEFQDLIAQAFYQAVQFEMENLCAQLGYFTLDEKEQRLQDILNMETIQQILYNPILFEHSNPLTKGVVAALQNGNSKAALQLVSGRKETKNTTYRLSAWFRNLLGSKLRLQK